MLKRYTDLLSFCVNGNSPTSICLFLTWANENTIQSEFCQNEIVLKNTYSQNYCRYK